MFGKIADMSLMPTWREFPVVTEYVVDEYVISHRKMPALMAKVAEIIYIYAISCLILSWEGG